MQLTKLVKKQFSLSFLFAFAFLICQETPAQTTKYNGRGDLLVMGGLIEDTTGCEPARSFSGTIAKIATVADTDAVVGYEIVLKLAGNKQLKFSASVAKDAGAVLVDFDRLMTRNRRVGIKARACGSGGFMTVDEVRRL